RLSQVQIDRTSEPTHECWQASPMTRGNLQQAPDVSQPLLGTRQSSHQGLELETLDRKGEGVAREKSRSGGYPIRQSCAELVRCSAFFLVFDHHRVPVTGRQKPRL